MVKIPVCREIFSKISCLCSFVKIWKIELLLQEELEAHDGVSKGKYTIGLGQDCLAFCTELEDVISMRYLVVIA